VTSDDATRLGAQPGIRFPSPRSLQDLAEALGGSVDDEARDVVINRVSSPEHASDESLVPIFQAGAIATLTDRNAVVLVTPELASRFAPGRRWVHDHARWVLAKLLQSVGPHPAEPRVSPHAVIEPGASLAPTVRVGHGAVVLSGAMIGEDSSVEPNAVIYGSVRLGRRVFVGAGAIVGRPGFGWAHGPDGQVLRIPQLGGVEVEDDVEIGALATVDAGTLTPTRLRRGCKLDAQVHVGHNVEIGEATMVAAQTGFAGSVTVGRNVLVGGQVGVADHAVIGDFARLAGRSGVIGDIPPHATVAGYPAVDRMRWLRAIARMMRGRS